MIEMAIRVGSPDIAVKDKVLEDEPGDVEDHEEGEGGDAASLDDDGDEVDGDGNY